MTAIPVDNHDEIVVTLRGLTQTIKQMMSCSTDSLLIWLDKEADSWLVFATEHWDQEELRALKDEVFARFYEKYNVRIEPKELDDKRLSGFDDVMAALSSAC